MQFEHEDMEEDEEDQLRKRPITFGFSAMLDSIVRNERSHVGYTRLEPDAGESRIKRDRVCIIFRTEKNGPKRTHRVQSYNKRT